MIICFLTHTSWFCLKRTISFVLNYLRVCLGFHTTKGFVQLGLNVAAIIGSAYPGFSFGGRNSAGH